ncbi:MAG: prepilin-type N-terminal cleavage/methylation domain-containing protein [Dehalococcoidales bacterium]|nr:prepilin-type N-terminal cleavage/methylation domain-containing protein [Dehalococcoidales bacterium]
MKYLHYFPQLKKIIRRLKEQAGISLVETLVAVAILGIGITSFVTALSAGIFAVKIQNEDNIAQGLARTQMETIKAAPYDSTGNSYRPVDSPVGYDIDIAVSTAVKEKNKNTNTIQKVSVTITRDEEEIITLEDFKVNR